MMIYEHRQYQQDAVTALLKSLYYDERSHPIIAVPTGAGKTIIMGTFIYKYLEWRPEHNVVVLSHTETILEQDHEALQEFFPGIRIGLYSSGLGIKEIQKITVAGIQSIYKDPWRLKPDLVIIDECHTVPHKGDGMYRQYLKYHYNSIRVGMSATIFRTGTGYVHTGKGALFNRLVYDLCSMEKFNKLVEDGYLTELYSKPPKEELNVDNVKISAGDYNLKSLSEAVDREEITKRAIEEVIKFGKNYKSWLIFAIDIDHADHIYEQLYNHNIECDVLHSKSDNTKSNIINKFKSGKIQALVSVGMITTGFDAPNIDMIVLLRPTRSPVLHVQMIGRGLRVCPGKTHCLILDFAGNVKRLGPINDIQLKTKKGKGKGSNPIVKECPVCGCLHHPSVKVCNACGHKFKFKTSLMQTYAKDEIVKKDLVKLLDVDRVQYSIHSKKDRPDSLKVTYVCGLTYIDDYICYDHDGYAKYKANNWVDKRWTLPKRPENVEYLFIYSDHLKKPIKINVDLTDKYPKILGMIFDEN